MARERLKIVLENWDGRGVGMSCECMECFKPVIQIVGFTLVYVLLFAAALAIMEAKRKRDE